MFELAARLVGVYKVNHMTKSVTIENKEYVKGRQQLQQSSQQPAQSQRGGTEQTTRVFGPGMARREESGKEPERLGSSSSASSNLTHRPR